MITVKNVYKSFDHVHALDGFEMHVEKGSIYGLIGPNGSGKTTIIKHLAGVLRVDAGEVLIDGAPVYENVKAKQKIGYMSDQMFIPHGYTLKDMCKLYQSFYPTFSLDRYQDMVKLMKLRENTPLASFSKGMKKQACLILVMSVMPELLLLDEPFDGLDPIVRRIVRRFLIDDVAERQTTVLVSSHNLKELEDLCDHIGIINHGQMMLERDLDDLRGSVHKIQVAYNTSEQYDYPGLDILYREKRGSTELLIMKNDMEDIKRVIDQTHPLIFDILPLSLEEVFIYELGGDDDEVTKLIF